MFKYRKFTGKKEVTTFVWRDSLPTEPIAGTFYWVDDENGTALYFANYDSELLRLDNKNISELDLSDELKKKINNITIDELNNLMTINIDDKKYYSTIFAGVSSPTIPAQSSVEITTSNTKSIQITQNDTGVTTKWIVSTSEITTNDFSSWNTGTSATISGISSKLETTYYVYAVNIKNGINSDVSSSIYNFKRQQIAPKYVVIGDNYSTSRTCKITENPVLF